MVIGSGAMSQVRACGEVLEPYRLFADKRKPSPFVSELTGSAYDGIVVVEATAAMTVEFCPQCSVGVVVPRTGRYGSFAGCSTFPVCDFTRSGSRH